MARRVGHLVLRTTIFPSCPLYAMFFRRKKVEIDVQTIEWITKEILNLKTLVESYRSEIANYASQVASLRGKYNNIASGISKPVEGDKLSTEEDTFLKSTVEYQEFMKGQQGLNNPET